MELAKHEQRLVTPRHQPVVTSKQVMDGFTKAAVYILTTIGAIIFIAPWAWMLSASFQPIGAIFNWPPTWIPEHFTLLNYQRFFAIPGFARQVFNSAVIAGAVTLLQLFINSMAAYTFAKRTFPGRNILFLMFMVTMMIPGQVMLIPAYLILQHVPLFGGNDILGMGGHGWLDSYWGLILPAASSIYGIFLLRQYMKSIPDELIDASKIDGASEFRIYAQIILPLSGPALAAMSIFTFTYNWNDFFWPLIIISNPDLRTLPLGLALFVAKNRTSWDIVMAGSVIVTLPIMIVFLVFQRYFIRGIALTGMK
jgi:multiple sugar transport system permease protein